MAYKNIISKVSTGHELKGTLIEINANPKSANFILNSQAQQAVPALMQQIWATRQGVYNKIYPEVESFANDPHDGAACVIYTRAATGEISSTARIAFDGPLGIPEKRLVPDLIGQFRRDGITFAELGRFIIDDAARGVLPNYFRAFYHFGNQVGVDAYVMFVQRKWISFYARLMDAKVVAYLDEDFGSGAPYAVMAWHLKETTPRFFSWCGAESHFAKPANNSIVSGVEL